MTIHTTIKTTKPGTPAMTQKEIFKITEDAKIGGRKKMIWFSEDQVKIMEQLQDFEPELSHSQIIRKSMNLYLRMHHVRGTAKQN